VQHGELAALVGGEPGDAGSQLGAREIGEGLEVAADLPLLEVLCEAQGVARAAQLRERARVGLRGPASWRCAAKPSDELLEPLGVASFLELYLACVAERVTAQQLEAHTVGGDHGTLERQHRAEQTGAGPRSGPTARARVTASARGQRESRAGAESAAAGHECRHPAHTSLRQVRISQAHWDELVAHARDEAPNECCGYLWATNGSVEGVRRAHNKRQSPYGYELDPESLLAVWKLDDEGGHTVGTYHSHPRSPAEPSQTDINLAEYPDWLYVIVSLEGAPSVRAWWIRQGSVEEEDLLVG
jgi:[CysO sulfur-carrier protein]-S-L-cysteine hydrolase